MANVQKFLKKLFSDKRFIIMLVILVVLIIAAIIIYNIKYSPTNETMTVNDYYEVKDGEMAVIVDGELLKESDGAPNAIVRNETPYVRYDLISDAINDVYAYDSREHIVNYTTKEGTYSASVGSKGYTFKGQNTAANYSPVVEENGTGYIALQFVKDTCGMDYAFAKDPARCALYTPGVDRTTATISSDIEMRRFGGNRSKILNTAKKGDNVTVVENYGSWSQILTEDAILGCIP
ncbi:MAG: hypothetical protein K5644_10665, partial [Lachnospiraceae bacterium]|nr:hypothetical protein [Lachnospiraceae bacterium]